MPTSIGPITSRSSSAHRQVNELLEASLADAETDLHAAAHHFGHTLFPFATASKRAAEARCRAANSVAEIRKRLAETNRVMKANEKELHEHLHAWLGATDEHYRLSFEVEHRYREITAAVEPLEKLFVELLARYGATRNEIGISYNKATGALSPDGRASVDRLVASYDSILKAETIFADKLTRLNALVERSIFKELMLPVLTLTVVPDCRPGMEYSELRAHFEIGAEQAAAAIGEIKKYIGRIKVVEDTERAAILYRYRDAEWKRCLAGLARSFAA